MLTVFYDLDLFPFPQKKRKKYTRLSRGRVGGGETERGRVAHRLSESEKKTNREGSGTERETDIHTERDSKRERDRQTDRQT